MSINKKIYGIVAAVAVLGIGGITAILSNNDVSANNSNQSTKIAKKSDKVVPVSDTLNQIQEEKNWRKNQIRNAKKSIPAHNAVVKQTEDKQSNTNKATSTHPVQPAQANSQVSSNNTQTQSTQGGGQTNQAPQSNNSNYTSSSNSNSSSYSAPANTQSTQTQRAQQPAKTYGFTINGRGFDLQSYDGFGMVNPGSVVYKWSQLPNYYLADALGASGQAAHTLGVGSQIKVGNSVYHVTQILNHVSAYRDVRLVQTTLRSHFGALQACVDSSENMNVYYFD